VQRSASTEELMPRASALRIGVAAALAAGTSIFPGRTSAQSAPLRFAASPASTQAEAFYADKLGFFKQAGITSTETIVTRGSDAVNGVVDGDFDIGCSTPPSIASAIIHGLAIRVIAPGPVYVNPAPFGLYVAKSSPVRRAQDLLNTVVATQTLSDDGTLGIMAWLDQNHVDTTKVKFIELTFPSMAPALVRGEIAAAFIVEPFASAHKDDIREIPGVYDSLGKHWAYGAWFAKKDFIDANPAVVKAVASALYATAKRVNAHQDDIVPLLVQYSKATLDDARTIVKPVWAERAERSNFEPQMQLAVKFKLLTQLVSYEQIMGLSN
jgi:ABC-type nitrate/sulfonate/bicarbonate transport system substrate-binding protein